MESGDDKEDKVEDGEVNVEGGEVKVEDGEVSVGKEEGVVAPNPPENHSGNVGVPLSLCEVPFLEAAEKTLTFLRPFSEKIHQEYSESNGGGWGWSPRQAQCISMYEHKHQADSINTFPCPPRLLSLLDYPLVRRKLSFREILPSTSSARRISKDVMVGMLILMRLSMPNVFVYSFLTEYVRFKSCGVRLRKSII